MLSLEERTRRLHPRATTELVKVHWHILAEYRWDLNCEEDSSGRARKETLISGRDIDL